MEEQIRIAVCFSGQLRTWEKCIDGWLLFFEDLKRIHNAKIDIFCHLWDHNALPHNIIDSDDYRGTKSSNILDDAIILSEDEINNYISQLNPVSYRVGNKLTSNIMYQRIQQLSRARYPRASKPIKKNMYQHLYSVMYVSNLKIVYEVKHKFIYDVCIHMRNDLYLERTAEYHNSLNTILHPKFNTIYSCHTGFDEKPVFKRRLGDIFWYADSTTFDMISDFYQWIMTFDPSIFNELGPEHLFYYYAKMFSISVDKCDIIIKLVRDSKYINPEENAEAVGWKGELREDLTPNERTNTVADISYLADLNFKPKYCILEYIKNDINNLRKDYIE